MYCENFFKILLHLSWIICSLTSSKMHAYRRADTFQWFGCVHAVLLLLVLLILVCAINFSVVGICRFSYMIVLVMFSCCTVLYCLFYDEAKAHRHMHTENGCDVRSHMSCYCVWRQYVSENVLNSLTSKIFSILHYTACGTVCSTADGILHVCLNVHMFDLDWQIEYICNERDSS